MSASEARDYVQQTLNLLMDLTQRIQVTSADYSQTVKWEAQGIPWSIVERTIQEKVARSQSKGWLPKLRLDWLDAEVQDAYRDWARAVGGDAARRVAAQVRART